MKLTYTEEMKQQDELWKIEKEDIEVMEKLFYEIMEQATQKGFNGYYKIYQTSNECICEVYDNEEEMQKCINGEIDVEFMFGYCEVLIEHLEQYYSSEVNKVEKDIKCCPICKNKTGFVFGTCCECGYNYINNTYHAIRVSTEILKRVVSPDVFDYLVAEHEDFHKNLCDCDINKI